MAGKKRIASRKATKAYKRVKKADPKSVVRKKELRKEIKSVIRKSETKKKKKK